MPSIGTNLQLIDYDDDDDDKRQTVDTQQPTAVLPLLHLEGILRDTDNPLHIMMILYHIVKFKPRSLLERGG